MASNSNDVDHEAKKPKVRIIASEKAKKRDWKKGRAITDFVLRLGAFASVLGASTNMAMADQKLPFFTQFFQFEATYNDMPALQYFVIGTGLVTAYLFISLIASFIAIRRPHVIGPRLSLLIMDTVALSLVTSCGSAATAIVYLAHNGNSSSNWLAVCMQFTNFCQVISGAVISAFIAVLILVILVALSAIALKRT